MFETMTAPEFLAFLVLGAVGGYLSRRRPMLWALGRLTVNDTNDPAVVVEGRPAGIVANLLTPAATDPSMKLVVSDTSLLFRSDQPDMRLDEPIENVQSCGVSYSRSSWMLAPTGLVGVASWLTKGNPDWLEAVLGGSFVAAWCAGMWAWDHKLITMTIRLTDGRTLQLPLKGA